MTDDYQVKFEKDCQDMVDEIANRLNAISEGTSYICMDEDGNEVGTVQSDKELEEWIAETAKDWMEAHPESFESLDEAKDFIKEERVRSETMEDYLGDNLGVKYIVDENKEYCHAFITVTWGGPNIYVDSWNNEVSLYWGSTHKVAKFCNRVADEIDEYMGMVYGE